MRPLKFACSDDAGGAGWAGQSFAAASGTMSSPSFSFLIRSTLFRVTTTFSSSSGVLPGITRRRSLRRDQQFGHLHAEDGSFR